jgi:ferric-dicitrate binding protein FerR (iron transport regulator)
MLYCRPTLHQKYYCMKEKIENPKPTNRRKFFLWGAGILSAAGILRWVLPAKKKKETFVKMLGEDGQLVVVDMSRVQKTGIKVSNEEVHNWIKAKPTK